jgi:hypothetical protein
MMSNVRRECHSLRHCVCVTIDIHTVFHSSFSLIRVSFPLHVIPRFVEPFRLTDGFRRQDRLNQCRLIQYDTFDFQSTSRNNCYAQQPSSIHIDSR